MNLHNTSMMNNFPYLYRGIVLDIDDPKKLGRCKVKVPSIHGDVSNPQLLPWSRAISSTSVSKNRGSCNIPQVGDVVWVLFEGGDKDAPVYIGGTYGIDDIPVDNNIVVIYQEGEDILRYNRENRTYIMQVGDRLVRISPTCISVKGDLYVDGNIHYTGVLDKNLQDMR